MEYVIGMLLALVTCVTVTVVGLDRGRSFYPVVMIVIASYYCLFAVMGGSRSALWLDGAIALLFAGAAVIGFRTTLWLVAAALAAHGAMDLIHHNIVANAGVPSWWPGFCAAFDITAAAYLAASILLVGHARETSPQLPETSARRTRRRLIQSGQLLVASAFLVSFLAIGTAHAQGYRPSFHHETLKRQPTGRPNEVLVLGTAHLSAMSGNFVPDMLLPLLDRLASWRPTGIATEDMSGLHCDSLRRYPARYAETVRIYCSDPAPAFRATGLDVPAANAEAERQLAVWPANPSAAQRRRLAATFLAAGERGSALVQWLRLAAADRRAGDGLNDDLVTALNKLIVRRSETSLVSAVLAARLGLERLWSMDDHSSDTPDSPDPAEQKASADAIARAWDNPSTRARQAGSSRLEEGLARPEGIIYMYRALNAPDAPMLAYRSDLGAALFEPSPQQFGRSYVGYWETRNLRMVANIRDVLSLHPGARLLAIVGATHKGYFEAYLNQMHDVRLVDANIVLR